jgi:molybdenum-dependent DNA-binding transcriptional regulator ModE
MKWWASDPLVRAGGVLWTEVTMTREQKVIRGKVGLLELAKQLGSVSQACKILGYSRDRYRAGRQGIRAVSWRREECRHARSGQGRGAPDGALADGHP